MRSALIVWCPAAAPLRAHTQKIELERFTEQALDTNMRLVVGCDLDEFKSYYEKTISSPDYRGTVGESNGTTELKAVA